MLSTIIGDGINDYSKLTIAGSLNGDDIVLLRKMAGVDTDNTATQGKLSELNLAEAHFVEGGSPFGPYNRHTKTNMVSQGMFAYCPHLSKITLPTDVTSIEKDAFEGCTSLRNILVCSLSRLVCLWRMSKTYSLCMVAESLRIFVDCGLQGRTLQALSFALCRHLLLHNSILFQ